MTQQRPVQQPTPVPTQVQQQVAAVPIPEPTLVPKQATPVQPQPQVAQQVTMAANPTATIPDLAQVKTGNPAIDDDITTVI